MTQPAIGAGREPEQTLPNMHAFPRTRPSLAILLLCSATLFATGLSADDQSLNWTSPATDAVLLLHKPYPITATASSGLPVTFRVKSGPAIIADGTVTATNVGSIALVAEQTGNAAWAPVSETRIVNRSKVVMTPAGSWTGFSRGDPRAVFVAGSYAYVALDTGVQTDGVAIIDVRNPARPVRIGSLDTYSVWVWDVQVVGNLAYVAQQSGMQIFDVGDPAKPIRVGQYCCNNVWSIHVEGDRAYAGANFYNPIGTGWANGFLILDVSNPKSPVQAGGYFSGEHPWGFTGSDVAGHLAYAIDGDLRIIDVSDPSKPLLVGRHNGATYQHVQVVGNLAYVAAFHYDVPNRPEFEIINVGNPKNPESVSTYESTASVWKAQIVGNLAYLANDENGLQILDVTNPAKPLPVAQLRTTGRARDVHVVGNYAYIASTYFGLQIIDVSNPAKPSLAGVHQTWGSISGLQVNDTSVFLVDGAAGLQIIDVHNSTKPTLVGGHSTGGTVNDAQVVGSFAYIADHTGLQILDVRDPTSRVRTGGYDFIGGAVRVQVVGSLAYVIAQGELHTIDVSDAANPVRVGGFAAAPDWLADDVQVVGTFAYVQALVYGADLVWTEIKILDVSKPANPVLVGSYAIDRLVGVHVFGNLAFFASDGIRTGSPRWFWEIPPKLEILDMSNSANPVHLVNMETGTTVRSVQKVGNLAYVASDSGIVIIDVSDPVAPVEIGNHFDGAVIDIKVTGQFAYVTDGQSGLRVLRLREGIPNQIQFEPPREVLPSESPMTLGATAPAGLSVSFSVVSGPATITGNDLTLIALGTVVVRAEHPGNDQFLPVSVERTINAPMLTIDAMLNGYRLSWPAWAFNFTLESADGLADPFWRPVPESTVEANGIRSVSISFNGSDRFFRLRMQ